jgi:hypothetical protein
MTPAQSIIDISERGKNMTSRLADLDLSDPEQIAGECERARQLINAYDRIESLQDGLKDLLGLIRLLSNNRDIPEVVRDDMLTSHRFVDAEELLR